MTENDFLMLGVDLFVCQIGAGSRRLLDARLEHNAKPAEERIELIRRVSDRLGNVTVIVMRGLEDGDGGVRRYRSILRRFVVPAFASAKAQVDV